MRPAPSSIRTLLPRRLWWRGRTPRLAVLGGLALAVTALATSGAAPTGALGPEPFLVGFNTVTTVASTVPANGDVNPYGIVNVPQTVGSLVRGDTLVSNFNATSNLQGTGTTNVQIAPDGQQSVFAQLDGPLPGACPGGVGLTTALTVLQGGIVVVGSLPVTINVDAVEVTPFGAQVDHVRIDPAGAGGDLFGLTVAPNGHGLLFVDDGDNTLKLFHRA